MRKPFWPAAQGVNQFDCCLEEALATLLVCCAVNFAASWLLSLKAYADSFAGRRARRKLEMRQEAETSQFAATPPAARPRPHSSRHAPVQFQTIRPEVSLLNTGLSLASKEAARTRSPASNSARIESTVASTSPRHRHRHARSVGSFPRVGRERRTTPGLGDQERGGGIGCMRLAACC